MLKKLEDEKSSFDTSPVKSSRERIAGIISEISNPLFIALPTFLIIALRTAPDILHALLWWIVTVIGISVAPLLFILSGVRRGLFSDHHVSIREQRFIPLFFGIGCMVIAFILLYFLGASHILTATITSVIVACAIAVVITKFTKISLHLVGMAGAVTVFVLLFGPLFLLLLPLILLVGWARWLVQAHTIPQAFAGTFLATSVTIITFWLFGIL